MNGRSSFFICYHDLEYWNSQRRINPMIFGVKYLVSKSGNKQTQILTTVNSTHCSTLPSIHPSTDSRHSSISTPNYHIIPVVYKASLCLLDDILLLHHWREAAGFSLITEKLAVFEIFKKLDRSFFTYVGG